MAYLVESRDPKTARKSREVFGAPVCQSVPLRIFVSRCIFMSRGVTQTAPFERFSSTKCATHSNSSSERRASPEGRELAGRRPSWPLEKDNFCLRSVSDRAAPPPRTVLDGPINGVWFQAFVDRFLVLTPVRGNIVMIDNLGSHVGASDTGQSGPEAKNKLLFPKDPS
jgi:hypothetical protein